MTFRRNVLAHNCAERIIYNLFRNLARVVNAHTSPPQYRRPSCVDSHTSSNLTPTGPPNSHPLSNAVSIVYIIYHIPNSMSIRTTRNAYIQKIGKNDSTSRHTPIPILNIPNPQHNISSRGSIVLKYFIYTNKYICGRATNALYMRMFWCESNSFVSFIEHDPARKHHKTKSQYNLIALFGDVLRTHKINYYIEQSRVPCWRLSSTLRVIFVG